MWVGDFNSTQHEYIDLKVCLANHGNIDCYFFIENAYYIAASGI